MKNYSGANKNKINKAVFLDRDGVINYPVFNSRTNEYEAPHKKEDLKLFPEVIEALKSLLEMSYRLFLVSNQPDYAKGKTSMENLYEVHKRLKELFEKNNISFTEYYYCYHHPQGIITEYSFKCQCRKPGNLFLKQAESKYGLNMSNSWMVGDRDADINCGQSAGVKTILIKQPYSDGKTGQSNPEFSANSLKDAVEIIKSTLNNRGKNVTS